MNKRKEQANFSFETVISGLILVVLVIYAYAKFFQHPYLGFRVDSTGQVIFVFDRELIEPTLRVGDKVLQINSVNWEDFKSDLRKTIFPNAEAGQMISLLIERDGRESSILWEVPGPNPDEIIDLLVSEGWLAFFFWFAGTITLLNLRPKDERWYLIIAFNYLTALLLAFGSGVSFYHIWGSAILQRMVVWLCVPVYLHLHWIFPYPFRKMPRAVLWIGYSIAVLLAIAEWFQLLPPDTFFTGFLLAFGGSIVLLLIHAILQPETRRDRRLFLVLSFAAFLPSIATGIVGSFVEDPAGRLLAWIGGGALLSLPLLPLAYFYAAYRRQLGKLELRVNRLVTGYLFFTLLAVTLLIPISLLAIRYNSPGATIIIAILFVIIAGLISLQVYPKFESFVERRLFGIRLPTKRILELYSAHITTSSSVSDLIRFLDADLLPSLLVQQFVFLQVDQMSTQVLFMEGELDEAMPPETDIANLLDRSGTYLIPETPASAHNLSWIRLILPLRLDGVLIGLWLFGSRDPDDAYSQLEIPILQSLANQTAVALSNIRQAERIKSMYEANIDRYEQERLRLSRDLHDSILNEMAALLIRRDAPVFTPQFQQAFEALTERLREIVSNLRPPTLNFGLKFALEDMAETLSERQNLVKIEPDIQADQEWRYPELVENHSYRIVQEACENALKYAHAKTIRIVGRLDHEAINLKVEDDGIGFNPETKLKFDEMLANKHFGMAGMYERANLIGADIRIHSQPNQGVQIHVIWKSKGMI